MAYTEDLTGGQVYIASSEFSVPEYQKAYAFDNNETNVWYATGYSNQWVGVDFGVGISYAVSRIRFRSARINAFSIDASNNGSTWTTIHTNNRANNSNWQTFDFANTTAYRYWRIQCTGALYSGSNVDVIEAEMMASLSVFKTSGMYIISQIDATTLPTEFRFKFTSTTPTDTSVTAEYAFIEDDTTPPESWTSVADDDVIEAPDPATGYFLWIRFTLETTDTAVTPSITAIWLEEATADPNKIQIILTDAGRMKYPQGDVSIAFTGAMSGAGGAMVAPFTESFTPEGIVPFFNPNAVEYLTAKVSDMTIDVKEIVYLSAQNGDEYLTAKVTGMTIVVTKVGELPL